MNIIIVGCGKVGRKLAIDLSADKENNVTVIDTKDEVTREVVNQCDAMGVVGNGASLDILTEAGVDEADILIAVTGSDELNLLTCLIAKKSGVLRTVARVRKPEYGKEINIFKEDLGLEMIINPEQAAAAEIARVLRFPTAIRIDTFAKGRAEILRFKIGDKTMLNEMKVSEIHSRLNCDVLVCGVERGNDAFIPNGDFVLKCGDVISIVASLKDGTDFFKKVGIKTNKAKDTIIVGGGATGYYLAKLLIQSGISVKIIEQNKQRCEELCRLLPKAKIINGDGTDKNILLEEGIENTRSFVALTSIDEENIMLSLYVKTKTDGKTVTKINRIAYDEVINTLNLDTIICPQNITAEYIAKFVRAKKNSIGSNIEAIHFIFDGKAEALEFRIGERSPVSDIPIERLKLKKNILIACINRNGRIIMPKGGDIILPGDTVIIITTRTGFKDINDILE